LKVIILTIAMLLALAAPAVAQAPNDGSCERYGCLYEHWPTHYTRNHNPAEWPKYGIANQPLPDGPDGRRFVNVIWPEGYDPARRAMWDRVAQCESRQRWGINTGNGYYGGLQFSKSSWDYVGGTQFAAYPHHAYPAQQIAVAERLLDTPPYERHWPHCGPAAGLHR
jgi:hypothetical protein